ncbi:hypothetical protein [Candidatus Vampirococcus lugosii]|uniref:hypothetical protein n=1 Tax=Candidatus Vampirococcus lugosii TaxID=2789015 RepID=UPI001BCED904|nr:hypothetical protein [Candidatus Vampirococcus lugosii]
MKRFFKKLILWIYIKLHSILIHISIALHRTEIDILKANPTIGGESGKKIQRHRHQNQILEKFYAGQRDEKYVKNYYELLKKADKFKRESNSRKYEIAAWKHTGGFYGKADENNRKYEHFGFFDDKHKHAGKTIKEVMEEEYKERRLDDDGYEILYIFNNKPIEVGLSKAFETTKKTGKKKVIVNNHSDENIEIEELEVLDLLNKSKQFKFPMTVSRKNENVVNKIEQLSEFLHVKKIGFEHRILEFFIPLKFKTNKIDSDSSIFKEIINIEQIHIKDEYGELKSFGLLKYEKRIKHKTYEVLKFQGIEMEKLGNYGNNDIMSDFLNKLKEAVDKGEFNSSAANKINEINKLVEKKTKEIENNGKGDIQYANLLTDELKKRTEQYIDSVGRKVGSEDEMKESNTEYEKKMGEFKKIDFINKELSILIDMDDVILENIKEMMKHVNELVYVLEKEFNEKGENFIMITEKIENLKSKYNSIIN